MISIRIDTKEHVEYSGWGDAGEGGGGADGGGDGRERGGEVVESGEGAELVLGGGVVLELHVGEVGSERSEKVGRERRRRRRSWG